MVLYVVAYCCITYGPGLFISPGIKHPHKHMHRLTHTHAHTERERETQTHTQRSWINTRTRTCWSSEETLNKNQNKPPQVTGWMNKTCFQGDLSLASPSPQKYCTAGNIPRRRPATGPMWLTTSSSRLKLCFISEPVWQRFGFTVQGVEKKLQDSLFSFIQLWRGIPLIYI